MILMNPFFVVSYNLEPYGAERIDIPRGPASVLYGQGSPGGLVNYISKLPKPEAFGELGLVVGNHDRIEGQVDFGSALNDSGSVSYRLTGLYRDSETQIDFVEEDRQYIATAVKWQIGDATSLTFLGNFQQDDTKNSQALPAEGTLLPNPNGIVPISRFTGEPNLDMVDRTEFSVGYQFEHVFSDTMRFFQNTRFNDVDLNDIVVFSNGFEPDQRTITRGAFGSFGQLEGLTIDNQLHVSLSAGNTEHKLLFGLDYLDVEAETFQQFGACPQTNPGCPIFLPAPDLDVFDPVYGLDFVLAGPFRNDDIELDQLGLYVQDEIRFNNNFIVNLAVRYDDASSQTYSKLSSSIVQDQDDGELTFRAGALYLMENGFAPYVSYAESFLPSAGVDALGNPFKPETGNQYEVGVKFQPQSFKGIFTLAYFDIERKDIVDRDVNFVLFQTGKASSSGIELEAYASLDNGLSIIANYNYLDTEFEDHPDSSLIGKAFTQIPENKASAWLDYNFQGGALGGLGFGFGVRYQSETFSDDLNTIESPSFTLYDAALHYQWSNFRVAINVQNIADKEYTSACFVRNSLLCTFGETRAIRGTITYRWQ
jgi:iron complex outermembrane receptor protein